MKEFKSVTLQCAMDDIILASTVRGIPSLWTKRMAQIKRWKKFYTTGTF